MILTPNFVSPVTERKKGMQAQSVWYRLVFFSAQSHRKNYLVSQIVFAFCTGIHI